MADTQSRKWLLTINNPSDKGITHDSIKNTLESAFKGLDYWCLCDEIGANKTYHIHFFIYRKNPVRFSKVKSAFPTAHIDKASGTAQDNRDYIRKEGKHKGTDKEDTNLKDTFEEFGSVPVEHQGQRNDLHTLYDWIKQGMTNYEILEENPDYMMDLEKIERCRQILKQEEFKNRFRELQVEYYYGKPGTGKTRSIMERYGYENVYRVTDTLHPWDSYKGQDVVIFEEFHCSNFKITDMLNYLDGYPMDLPCRYNNKTACYTKVYLLSNTALEYQYTDVKRSNMDTWDAFCRRIHCVKIFDDKEHIREFYGIKEYLRRWEKTNNTPFDKGAKKNV